MTLGQPHPQRCETCNNTVCEYYEIRDNMSAGHDERTGWRASPAVITFAVGCASHSSTPTPAPDMPSSEPEYIHIKDGSDRDYRLISMYELQKIEHAINEECVGKNDGCPPGHLQEMHDRGIDAINKVRFRPAPPAPVPDEKCYIITETGMNLAIAVLKSNRLYDTAELVLKEIRPAPTAEQKQPKEICNSCTLDWLECGIDPEVCEQEEAITDRQREWSIVTKEIYEKGKVEGAKFARERVLENIILWRNVNSRGKLKKDIWMLWDLETRQLESLRAQQENSSKEK